MSSRSIGVTNVGLSRWMMSCVIRSPSCSASRISSRELGLLRPGLEHLLEQRGGADDVRRGLLEEVVELALLAGRRAADRRAIGGRSASGRRWSMTSVRRRRRRSSRTRTRRRARRRVRAGARAPPAGSSSACSGPGNARARTASAYAVDARAASRARTSANALTNFGYVARRGCRAGRAGRAPGRRSTGRRRCR